jgi:ribosome-binding factor A
MRAERVARSVQEELTGLLREVKDPRVADAGLLTVTHVRVSDDLGVARVQIALRRFDGQLANAEQTETVLDGLNHAAPFLRRQIGKALRAKKVPELRFHFDEVGDKAARVEELLAEIKSETKP